MKKQIFNKKYIKILKKCCVRLQIYNGYFIELIYENDINKEHFLAKTQYYTFSNHEPTKNVYESLRVQGCQMSMSNLADRLGYVAEMR